MGKICKCLKAYGGNPAGGEKKLKIQGKARFPEGKVWEPDHRTGFSKEQPLLHLQAGGKQDPESPHDLPTSPTRTQVSSVLFPMQFFFFFSLLLKLECSRGSEEERGIETKTGK